MNIDADKLILDAIQEGICNAIKSKIEGYNSPLEPAIRSCVAKHETKINAIIDDAIGTCVNDDEFKAEIMASTRTQLARTLVQRIGGELEKQVNALKSSPTTRARITMAIDAIIKDTQ